MKAIRNGLIGLSCLVLIAACAPQKSPSLEPVDGLTQVKRSKVDELWVRPGFSPAKYSKIMINGSGIEFRPVGKGSTPLNRSRNEFELSDKQQEKFKQIMVKEFTKELSQLEGYEHTDTAGPDTLTLDIQLLDVVSRVPPPSATRSTIYLTEVARATLSLTFTDSNTGERQVLVIDRRPAESYDGFGFKESTPANNWRAVKGLAKHWAKGLRKGLEKMNGEQ